MNKSKLLWNIKKANFSQNYCNYSYIYSFLVMKFHKDDAVNKNILSSKGSYVECEQKLDITDEDYNYDFFNTKMVSNAVLSKKYINEVVSYCLNPNLFITHPKNFMKESRKKAETYFKNVRVGAYTCSKGLETVRKNISAFMKTRDEMHVCEDNIFLTYGGMDAYQHILSLFRRNEKVSYF
jgi:hypothetical protein